MWQGCWYWWGEEESEEKFNAKGADVGYGVSRYEESLGYGELMLLGHVKPQRALCEYDGNIEALASQIFCPHLREIR